RAEPRPREGGGRGEGEGGRRHRRQRPRGVPPIRGSRPGGCRHLAHGSQSHEIPGGPHSGAALFRSMTITSPHNEKLKLIRRLGRRRGRKREGLFLGEGEDLLAAARRAGAEPRELPTAAGEGLGGTEVEPALLARVSNLGSGTRAIGVWREIWAEEVEAPCVYMEGVSDPGNVGTVIRTADALVGGTLVLGPDCADPF